MAKPVTSYTPEVGERVCALIANGWSVGKIGRAPGLPSRTTIFTWLAIRRFPSAEPMLRRKKDGGRADAALLALYHENTQLQGRAAA